MKNIKSLGQNWLKDRPTLESIADLVTDFPETSPENPPKLCIEIGPGLGTLTSSLLKRFDKVFAIEFDSNLAQNLPKSFPGKNLTVFNEDILKFDFDKIEEPFVVAGNIPYYITTPIIEKLLSLKNKPEKIVLLVQKEVAEKINKIPSNSSLSIFVENFADTSLGPIVLKNLFTPPPKVDSRILILTPHNTPKTSNSEILNFIHKCFSNPRKKLSTNLALNGFISKTEAEQLLTDLGFGKNARPSDLNLNNYIMLAKKLKKR